MKKRKGKNKNPKITVHGYPLSSAQALNEILSFVLKNFPSNKKITIKAEVIE